MSKTNPNDMVFISAIEKFSANNPAVVDALIATGIVQPNRKTPEVDGLKGINLDGIVLVNEGNKKLDPDKLLPQKARGSDTPELS